VYLGKPDIWIRDAESLRARKAAAEMPQRGLSLDEVSDGLVNFFNGMVDWGHPHMGMNVIPPSTLPSIGAHVMAAMFSPNLIEEEYCVNVAAAEIDCVAMCARLAGYDPVQAGGIFTFGGLGTWMYAMKVALTKALGKESRARGIREDVQVITSESSHFSKFITSDWIGLGTDNVREVVLNSDNAMNLDALRETLEDCHRRGQRVALINATTGTTDAFGVDDVKGIVAVRDAFVARHGLERIPHVHADAVIGWAWMAFRGYDFDANPLEFEPVLLKDLRAVAARFTDIHSADSIGFDFHKTGYAPYVSSMFLARDGADFDLLARPAGAEAYLFHFGAYNPGEYSLESSRSAAGALAAWANLKHFGLEGYQVLLARLVYLERILRGYLDARPAMVVLNPEDHGFVTLYRVYPEGVDAKAQVADELAGGDDDGLARHNEYVHRLSQEIFRRQREERGPFLSYTSSFRVNPNGQRVAALKVFPMTPFATEDSMRSIADAIEQARKNVEVASGAGGSA